MADLIIRPKNDDHLKLQNDAGTTIVELANDESKLRLAQNNISASDGTTAITTSGANVTLAGTTNNIGTVSSGTLGSSVSFPQKVTDHTYFYYLIQDAQYMSAYGTYLVTENVEGRSQRINGIAPTNFTSVQDIKCWFICAQTPPNSGASPYTPTINFSWQIGSSGSDYNSVGALSSTTVSGYSTDLLNRLNAVSLNNVGTSGSTFEDLISSADGFGMEMTFGGAFARRALGISITWRF